MIDYIVFYAVSAIFRSYNGGPIPNERERGRERERVRGGGTRNRCRHLKGTCKEGDGMEGVDIKLYSDVVYRKTQIIFFPCF